jgi:hypothetical protein
MAWSWRKLLGLASSAPDAPAAAEEPDRARPARLAAGAHRSVESQLVNDVVDLFVHEFGVDAPAVDEPREVVAPRQDRIGPGEIAAMWNAIASRRPPPPPPLQSGLEEERLWILADLARHASPRGRAPAEQELAETLRQQIATSGLDRMLAARVLGAIEQAAPADGLPENWRRLLDEARRAAAAPAEPAAPGGDG